MPHAALWIAAVVAAAQPSGTSPLQNRDVIELEHCVISLIDHVELPAEEEGKISELLVKEEAVVTQGQVLGQLDVTDTLTAKKVAEARLAVAHEKATNDAEVQVARKLIDLAKAEYEESLAINKRSPGTIPETTLRRQRVTWEKALLDTLAAEMTFKIAGLQREEETAQLEAVDNRLNRRTIRAPFDGVVVKIHRQQSEWVKPGEPIMRLVRMDRLRIEGFVNADLVAPDQLKNAEVKIVLRLPGDDTEVLTARILEVSSIVEASRYRIWTEVDNQPGRGGYKWLMRPGAEAKMVITKNPRGAAAAYSPR
ncbi:MAG: HlyD family efflux transporter periplasmic adaptor subunit [Pirellulaceae bacterium]|nr:HlyD family efflux transporter periplasmic adaptor subunit [Pirellulaceae bacterium]